MEENKKHIINNLLQINCSICLICKCKWTYNHGCKNNCGIVYIIRDTSLVEIDYNTTNIMLAVYGDKIEIWDKDFHDINEEYIINIKNKKITKKLIIDSINKWNKLKNLI